MQEETQTKTNPVKERQLRALITGKKSQRPTHPQKGALWIDDAGVKWRYMGLKWGWLEEVD